MTQQQFPNQEKYIKKYHTFKSNLNTTRLDQTRFYLKDKVLILDNHPKHAGKVGEIVWGASKTNKDDLKVKFKSGKSALIDKSFLKKISDSEHKAIK